MTDRTETNVDEPIETEATEGAAEEAVAEDAAAATTESAAAHADATDAEDLPSEGRAPTREEVEEAVAEEELDSDLDRLQSEFDELNERHLRLAAEFSNFRRRAETERTQSWARAQADLLRHMVEALDDLQRVGAWEAEATTVEALIEGVDLVERKFRQALDVAGVEVIDPVGEEFDPNIMEAMMKVPAESEDQDDTVQDVFQKGYSLEGHLIRPARVTVYKHE